MPTRKNNVFEFKYEGEFTSLDALTVLNSQINFLAIVKEIKDHKFPEINLDMRIRGLEKGSLDVNHVVEVASVVGMFTLDNYAYVQTIFTIFGDIVKLKKFLKGEKAEKVVEVKNGDSLTIHLQGDNMTIHPDAFKIYQSSPVITSAFNNTSKLLSNNKDIDFVHVKEKGKPKKYLEIQKEEFEALGEDNPYLTKRTDEQTYKNQILFIKKPNLFPEKNKKWVWELIHQGRDIKAPIVDETFKQQINDGLKIGQGDRLKADLKIFYKFDERLNTYIESQKFEVSNISDIIGRTDNTRLDFQ